MTDIRFAHMSDVHLGVWSTHPDLRELPLRAFRTAVDKITSENLDFVVIAGDFFDTSMPAIDVIKFAVEQLRRLQAAGVPVYAVAGSHDYSPTGKTMLGVLEAAGLLKNVHLKTTRDDKTGTILLGVEGLRGGLDKHTFDRINADVSGNTSFKIFIFHTAIKEYSIPMMESIPLSALPKGFDYYANGHVHVRLEKDEPIGKIVFPGPIFPCDFSELEKVVNGSFCIVDVKDGKPNVRYEHLKMCGVELIEVAAEGRHPKAVEDEFLDKISKLALSGKILLLKSKGRLASGKPSDVDWKRISSIATEHGALSAKRSIHIESPEAESVEVESKNIDEIEDEVLRKSFSSEKERKRAQALIFAMSPEKAEDETSALFEERLKAGVRKLLEEEGL